MNVNKDESLKRGMITSFFWKLLERGGSQLISLIVQVVLARLLSPEEFGAMAILLVFINLATVVVQSGLNTAIVQTPCLGASDCSTVFWMSLGSAAVLYAALFFGAPPLAGFYGMPDLLWPLRVFGLVLFVNAYNSVQIAIIQREMDFRRVFGATLAAALVSGAVGVAAALCGAALWALVAQQLVYQLVNALVLACGMTWRPERIFVFSRAKELFSYGWKLLASGLLDTGYRSLTDLIIGKQFDAAALGLVTQGKKYPAALGSMLDGAIQPVMLSAVARVQDDVDAVRRIVSRALKTSVFLVMPVMTCFALVTEPLVLTLLGDKWLPCVSFFQIYCLDYALLPIQTTNLQALKGLGRSDLFLKLEIVKKAYGIGIILFTAFVLRSVEAMVIGALVSSVLSTLVNAWPSKKTIGYSYAAQLRDLVPLFLLTFASAAIAWPLSLLGLAPVAQILLQALAMIASYLLLARLFRVEELGYLLSTARQLLASRKGARPR